MLEVANVLFEVLIVSFETHHPQDGEYRVGCSELCAMHKVVTRRLQMIDWHAPFEQGNRTHKVAMNCTNQRLDNGRRARQNRKICCCLIAVYLTWI